MGAGFTGWRGRRVCSPLPLGGRGAGGEGGSLDEVKAVASACAGPLPQPLSRLAGEGSTACGRLKR
ncbi:protein of unknown function [Cupriavidus taiwanensis]|nr:protein of unknown function [Cupriavidus taiwanensis]SPD40570.1 protein of unknown function [Cupriavidus taiwanensis]